MLAELVIENYAVIERLRVRFHPGLNLLTGETGSGKSIVVDALALLLGGRARADAIRSGQQQARIAGIFETEGNPRIGEILENSGFEGEDGELLIEREIQAGGKSRAFLGSRPASASLLKELAPHLADIHGQHDQQLLFSAEAQREMLDSFASPGPLSGQVREVFRALQASESQLEALERESQEQLRMRDVWEFQRREIESARPAAGEDAVLEQEKKVLQNLARLQEGAGAAYAALYDAPESALALMRLAYKRINELRRIDPALAATAEQVRSAELAIEDAAYALRDYLSGLEANPGRLEQIETRLTALDRLKRKYGSTLAEVEAYLAQIRARLESVEQSGERAGALRAERSRLADEFAGAAGRLSETRKTAARTLEKRVAAELKSLAMPAATFRIEISPAAATQTGIDAVRYLVSANRGEDLRPLERVASGGELSRIALALKSCLAQPASGRRTLVFDEVDAGIGGGAAEEVGRRLKRLAGAEQVLCVTHLAQIASFADHHYRVEKKESKGRTFAAIEELDAEDRTREVGRMLSGQEVTPEAMKHAERLIRMSAAR